MLDEIISLIPNGSPRHPIIFYRMLKTILARLELAREKFRVSKPVRTPGEEFIRWMLLNFNMSQAESYADDTTLYTDFICGYQDSFRNVFDPVWTKSLAKGKFVKCADGSFPTEIYVNCSQANPSTLPLGEDWNRWKDTRAIRIIGHDSLELPIDMFAGYVLFKEKFPTYVTISINIPILLMKWYKYCTFCKKDGKQADETEFFKRYEFEGFFGDLLDVWITNLIVKILGCPSAQTGSIVEEVSISNYITSDSIIYQGVNAIRELVNLVQSRNLRLQDFLTTSLYPNESCILDHIDESSELFVVSDLRQYDWIRMLVDLPHMKILSSIIALDSTNPLFNSLIRRAYNIYLRKIKFVNMPGYQHSHQMKGYIAMVCREFENLFKDRINEQIEDTAQL